jgi:hypothetical protein
VSGRAVFADAPVMLPERRAVDTGMDDELVTKGGGVHAKRHQTRTAAASLVATR